ncbi:MAG: hypothetical protein N2444_04490 [Methylocystis sp.]|nr:hypothetical protein [Methylocystis sp.]
MKELILLPAPKSNHEPKPKHGSMDNPGEIFIDPEDRRAARRRRVRRRPGAALFLAAIAGAGAWAFFSVKEAAKPIQPSSPNDAALLEKTQQQITALQSEVRELRAKLDATEKRPPAAPAPIIDGKAPAPVATPAPAAKELPAEAAPKAPPAKARAKMADNRDATAETPVAQSPAPAPKAVSGYRLREVSRGVAILETRRGVVAVRVGDTLTDVGQVNGIQKRAGRWVVSTDGGDIVGEAQAQARAPVARRRPFIPERYGYAPEPFMPSLFIPF